VRVPADGPSLVSREIQTQPATLEVRNHSRTSYRIGVNASAPFWLVLRESFHPGWRAYKLEGGPGTTRYAASALLSWLDQRSRRRPLDRHEQVGGYANAWYVGDTGNYEIVVEFWPQRAFEIGLFFSGIAAVVTIVLLCRSRQGATCAR
jgi:hypothetical protein